MNSLPWSARVRYLRMLVTCVPLLAVSMAAPADSSADDSLWGGGKITAGNVPVLPAVVHRTVHRAIEGEYQFLHGPAVVWFNGELFASWANSPVDENSAAETLRFSSSRDHGETWQPAGFIGKGDTGGVSHSHGTFQVLGDQLFAYAARFTGAATDGSAGPTFVDLKMELFSFDPVTRTWTGRGIVAEGFWPLDEPKRLANGDWMMGGLDASEHPVVARSQGAHLSAPWKVTRLPFPSSRRLRFAETSVFTADGLVRAVVRNTKESRALVSTSRDDGVTWSELAASEFPMGTAKPCAGVLSNGQPYLVSNLFEGRNVLGIAVGRPGSSRLQQVWRIRDGVSVQPRFPGRAKSPQWSYPYAYEHEGHLYVVYSVGKEDCELSIIPLDALKVSEPVKIIFDTDIGNDCDDAMALALVHALQNRGACELLAVTLTNPDPLAGRLVDAVNTFYGRPDIPIGVNFGAPVAVKHSRFLKAAENYPHDFAPERAMSAVELLRKVLAGSADGSVVLVQVGFFTNLAALLDSRADAFSPLSGQELVRRKVRELSVMAGSFYPMRGSNYYLEFNVQHAIPAARKVAAEWPTPVVWSGAEVGDAIRFPAIAVNRDFAYRNPHPIHETYQLYRATPHERPCFDLTSVLQAVWPDRKYFELSVPGRVEILADSFTRFIPAKEKESGRDRYLVVDAEQARLVREVFALLVTEPPAVP